MYCLFAYWPLVPYGQYNFCWLLFIYQLSIWGWFFMLVNVFWYYCFATTCTLYAPSVFFANVPKHVVSLRRQKITATGSKPWLTNHETKQKIQKKPRALSHPKPQQTETTTSKQATPTKPGPVKIKAKTTLNNAQRR